jgi:hypothetical protein
MKDGIYLELLKESQNVNLSEKNKSIELPTLVTINYMRGMKWILASPNIDELVELLA